VFFHLGSLRLSGRRTEFACRRLAAGHPIVTGAKILELRLIGANLRIR
jgi:hypothetical protein